MSVEETIKKLTGGAPPARILYLADNPQRSRYLYGDIRKLIGKPLTVFAADDQGFYLCQAPDGSMADVHVEDIKKK